MATNFSVWASLAFLLVGVPAFISGQLDWERIKNRPLEMYELYGNPADNAADGLLRVLLKDVPKKNDGNASFDLLEGFYLPSTDNSINDSQQCVHDTFQVTRAILNDLIREKILGKGHFWPLTLPDSWGSPGDGILNGNSLLWGFMEECTAIDADELIIFPPLKVKFRGNYCLIRIDKKPGAESNKTKTEDDLETKVWDDIQNSPDFYYVGTCIPSSCKEDVLMKSIEFTLALTDWEVVDVQCQTEEGYYGDATGGDIAFEVIIGIIWCVIVGASCVEFLVDLAKKPELKEGPLKYLLVVSSYRSMTKIFRIVNKSNPDVIDCLHGLRALSMIWVTWCHSYLLFQNVSQNMNGLGHITDSALDQIIFNGSFSVDTFFFMSGLLATYSVLREHDANGKVNWIMYYVHRIVRLLPAIALTCFFMATVARYALVGPYGPYIEKQYLEPCRKNWFMDVLFVSNFALEEGNRCLPQSWFTSLDTQLYILLPLVLVPLIMKRMIGMVVLCVVTFASFVVPISLFAAYNLKPYLPLAVPEVTPTELSLDNDHMPWSRASPYVIGIWAGWLLFTYKDKKIKMPFWGALIGWCVSAAVSCAVLFGVMSYNTLVDPVELPLWVSIFYGGVSRGAWALSLLWVVFACHKGFGGPVNTFLGHPCWLPMSRLAYSLFLIMVPVQLLSSGSTYIPLYMNHLNKFIETCGYLFVGGLMAIGVSITSEIPFLSIEKLISPRAGRNVQEEAVKES